MQTVVIVIHLLVVIVLVGVVLIQRSEGGGLGVGGGSGFMTARGTKNALTRLTAILAACFFLTSIILTVLQTLPGKDSSHILDQVPSGSGSRNTAPQGGLSDHQGDSAGQNRGGDAAVPEQGGAAAEPPQPPSQSGVPN